MAKTPFANEYLFFSFRDFDIIEEMASGHLTLSQSAGQIISTKIFRPPSSLPEIYLNPTK